MSENIIYKVNIEGKRGNDNWTGRFLDGSNLDSLRLCVYDKYGKPVSLSKGDRIHYSDFDMDCEEDYEIIDGFAGVYRVNLINNKS